MLRIAVWSGFVRSLNERQAQTHTAGIFKAGGDNHHGMSLAPWFSPSKGAPAESLQGTGLSLPCIAGDVTADGGVIWLRAERESIVAVEYGKDPALQNAVRSAPLKVLGDNDCTGKVFLRDLEPRSIYYCRAIVADKNPGPIARIRHRAARRPGDKRALRF